MGTFWSTCHHIQDNNTRKGQVQEISFSGREHVGFGRGDQGYRQVHGGKGRGGHNFNQIKVETSDYMLTKIVNYNEYIDLPYGGITEYHTEFNYTTNIIRRLSQSHRDLIKRERA